MRSEQLVKLMPVAMGSLYLLSGCVNPPDRSSGVVPRPAQSPAVVQPETTPPQRNDDINRDKDNPQPAAALSPVKISYAMNRTDNTNCLTIQPVGAASISAKCSVESGATDNWFTQELANSGAGAFKATVRIETTEMTTQRKITTASDNTGDQSWRWRCVKWRDKANKTPIHTVCYEDGNALAKAFDSSDLFVEFAGAETVELGGGVQCLEGNDIDRVTCMPK